MQLASACRLVSLHTFAIPLWFYKSLLSNSWRNKASKKCLLKMVYLLSRTSLFLQGQKKYIFKESCTISPKKSQREDIVLSKSKTCKVNKVYVLVQILSTTFHTEQTPLPQLAQSGSSSIPQVSSIRETG